MVQLRSFNNGSSSCSAPLAKFVTGSHQRERTSLMTTNSSSVLLNSAISISSSSTSSASSITRQQQSRVKKFLCSKIFVTTVLVMIIMVIFSTDQDEFHHSSSMIRHLPNKESCNQSSRLRFVGFWHIGNSNHSDNTNSSNQQGTGDIISSTTSSRDEFVQGQLKEIQSSHLFNECNNYDVTLNYIDTTNLSEQTKQKLSDDHRIRELPPINIENINNNEEYFEFPTLMELHSFCVNLPPDEEEDIVVFYLHTKSNDNWRRWMENYLMGEECVQCLEDPSMMAW